MREPVLAMMTLAVLILACRVAGAGEPAGAKIKATCRRANDAAEVAYRDGGAVVEVRSPFGISQATLEREGEAWPRRVTLRLHLKGLEKFEAGNGTTTLHGSVSSNEAGNNRLWQDAKEDKALKPGDPLWTEFRLVGADGKPGAKAPLEGGYFEVVLPRALFEGNPKMITVRWIDFYRN